jgi:hypothetical protein
MDDTTAPNAVNRTRGERSVSGSRSRSRSPQENNRSKRPHARSKVSIVSGIPKSLGFGTHRVHARIVD